METAVTISELVASVLWIGLAVYVYVILNKGTRK